MEVDVKVFSSKITRTSQEEKKNLYDLLKIVPAAPISLYQSKKNGCEFQPRSGKYYEPKKKNKIKVRTVRDIRNIFEKDVYSYLPIDLEKQQNVLLKKIIDGSSKTESTQQLARTILKCDNPISRSAWQMLMNINPDENIHPIQYVLWNGNRIRVCGSKGGNNKFISLVDLGKCKVELKSRKSLKRIKTGLLQNSLSVKFKPGPLQLKKYLDDSYQKYHVGNIELVNLPKLGLEIQTMYGCSLDPTITHFLNSLRDIDGTISQKWAEYAVSAVGNITASNELQIVNDSNVTFSLCFKYGQSRILMRRDIDTAININSHNAASTERLFVHQEIDVIAEVKNIIYDMLDCVEISLKQDSMYSDVDDERKVATDIDLNVATNNVIKEKPKKKYSELDRLHVTVIRLAENSENRNTTLNACKNLFCSLGCICFSLECPINLRRHCGRIDCMFECKCNFSKYKALDSFDGDCPDILPDLYNFDIAANSKLAKEEQKFHQTVIMTGEKSILLKSQRRNWKASKKYPDFYKTMPLRPERNLNRILTIVDRKLKCENIEPWCMVHNVYKCFCKGKFVDSVIPGSIIQDSFTNKVVEYKDKTITESETKLSNDDKIFKAHELVNTKVEYESNAAINPQVKSDYVNKLLNLREQLDSISSTRLRKQPERLCSRLISKRTSDLESESDHSNKCYNASECARIRPYGGRKFSNGYYNNTNRKIFELEKNDSKLRKRLFSLAPNHGVEDNLDTITNLPTNVNNKTAMNMLNKVNVNEAELSKSKENEDEDFSTLKIQDTCLKTWLENAFKQYKKSCGKGGITGLQAPQANKLALYPWEFILNRYRERKNHFLVSKYMPFRMFMAVDTKHPFFKDCINIDSIRFADLHKYPVTVKNLLTNATDLKDSFCILSGLQYCWELKGSVTKVIETNLDNISDNDISEIPQTETTQSSEYSDQNEKISSEAEFDAKNIVEVTPNSSATSKWFVMTVEDDFVEIQLSKRGFFVTYKNILHALRIARVSGKTARLSGLKNVEKNSSTPFGVYAIPNVNEDCVFIGPYENDEPLGIETVSSTSRIIKSKRTRGFWITTNKFDNVKVIDNPMSFVPPTVSEKSNLIPIDNYNEVKEKLAVSELEKPQINDTSVKGPSKAKIKSKTVKPIKIRKSDNMFRVNAKSILKSLTPQQIDAHSIPDNNISLISNTHDCPSTLPTPGPSCLVAYVVEKDHTVDMNAVTDSSSDENAFVVPPIEEGSLIKITSVASIPNKEKLFIIPPTEEETQIKISAVYSEADQTLGEKTKDFKQEGSMFVLKPEEINKRLLENATSCVRDDLRNHDDNLLIKMNETEIDTDIENFLGKNVISSEVSSDVFIISDDEEETTDEIRGTNVWIESKNIENFGWIPGKRSNDFTLSFKFPGFQFTEFYLEEIAFCKINQVLSRKICIPKNITIEWKIVETMSELKSSYQLESEHLGTDYVLTTRGLRNKRDLLKSVVHNFKTYSRSPRNAIEQKPDDKAVAEYIEEEIPDKTDTGVLPNI